MKQRVSQKIIDVYSQPLIELWNQFKTDKEISKELGLAITPTTTLRKHLKLPTQNKRRDFIMCKVCKIIQPGDNFNWNCKAANDIDRTCKNCHSIKMKNKRAAWRNRNLQRENFTSDISEKYCAVCNTTKHIDNFAKDICQPSGYANQCKNCTYNTRGVSLKNYMLKRKKSGAKQRQYGFTLTDQDLFLPEYCPILKTKLIYYKQDSHQNIEEKDKLNLASIDRIDNSKGYIPGNVIVMSKRANSMKSDKTFEDLRTYCENMLKLINHYEQNGGITNPQDVFPDLKLLD